MTGSAEPMILSGHNFSYVALRREKIHLTQAFDDGSTTVLQFDEAPMAGLTIRNPKSGDAVSYTVDQRYVIVAGVYGALAISVGGESATVVNPAMPSIDDFKTVAGVPDTDEKNFNDAKLELTNTQQGLEISQLPERVRRSNAAVPLTQEIAMLEENIRRLCAQIEAAHLKKFGESLIVRPMGCLPRVVMTFADNSAEVRFDDRLRGVMAAAARSATRIYLRGAMDATVASNGGTALAIHRAVEVRRLMISLNVDPARIRLFYRGAGDFLANNSTRHGKALHRRVEIEFKKW